MQVPKFIRAALLLSYLTPIMALTYLGYFTRYMADDFCTANIALSEGVIGSAVWWYQNWAGQLTNWTLKGIAGSIGPASAMALPALILAVWMLSLTWTLCELGLAIGLRRPHYGAFLLASVVVFATFDGAANIVQSLYWLGASIPYTTPLIWLTVYIGIFIRTLRKSANGNIPVFTLLAESLIPFIAGGLSETYAIFQCSILGIAILAVYRWAPQPLKRPALLLLSIGLISSVIALAVMLISPGNAVRQAQFPDPLPLPTVIGRVLFVTLSYTATALGVHATLPMLAAVLVSAWLVSRLPDSAPLPRMTPRRVKTLLLGSLGIALILVLVSVGPAIYAMGVAPPARAYIMPHFTLVMTAVFWGLLMGLGIRRDKATPSKAPTSAWLLAFTTVLIAIPMISTGKLIAQVPLYHTFAAEWDQRDQELRNIAALGERLAITTTLAVDLADMADLETISANPDGWVNQCAARYYGLETLTARTPLQMASKATP